MIDKKLADEVIEAYNYFSKNVKGYDVMETCTISYFIARAVSSDKLP